MYAQVAINAPVDSLYDYRVPPELEGRLQPGHLVQVPFGPGLQHGIVVELRAETTVPQTKLIQARLDPRPALTPAQIALGRWISTTYLSPIGLSLWLLLPPGLTGERDVLITLINEDSQGIDEVEAAVIALLKRRGPLRGQQMSVALPGKPWKAAVEALVKANVLERERILTPPKVRAQTFQTATLAITPQGIEGALRNLAKPSAAANVLEMIAQFNGEYLATSKNRPTIDKLAELGLVAVADDGTVSLTIPPSTVGERLLEFRKVAKPKRILSLLAAADGPVDVSEVYDQANVNAADLKRLDAEGLVVLGEKSAWRDSLADRGYVAATPPSLTPEQRGAWLALSLTIDEQAKLTSPFKSTSPAGLSTNDADATQSKVHGKQSTPPPDPLPARGEGEAVTSLFGNPDLNHEQMNERPAVDSSGQPLVRDGEFISQGSLWRTSKDVWEKIKPLAQQMRHQPTPAENRLWQTLRHHRFGNLHFRRQHPIDRFIVDFYCSELKLVIEVDGEIHDYTAEEDAYRQAYLEALGLRVLRFSNDEVLKSTDAVVSRIAEVVTAPPSPRAGRGSGGGVEAPEKASNLSAVSRPNESAQSPVRNAIFLLHGVTGSGKTEIYLRAIERTLGHGRDAIFLVPEIALTAQTVRRVAARFGRRVAIVHSGLSIGERFDTWRRAREGQVQVIVGARSALFTPLPDVGLIVIDEEHDHSYKQSESGIGLPPPYYHTRQVAEEMMRRNHGVLIVGSATPDVEVMYRAKQGEIQLLEMPNRVMGHRSRAQEQAVRDSNDDDAPMIELPPVQVVDMRRELKSGNTSIFSRKLQSAINETLDRREQGILFINRRGHATYVFCRDCGYVESCPRCESPLTYHRHGQALRCHRCGYEAPEPRVCPRCRSTRIKFFGAGTQQVEQALQIMYPRARIVRWDADTAATPDAHASIMQRFVDRRADILIGTQMVAKGLDLPMVTLVGVVSADMGVALPDFRAGERTFQLLTQVAGRAGRGLLGGQVVLQTYQPEHYAIDAASRHDYTAFYAREIAYRREIGYPPFRRLVRVIFRSDSEPRARAEAERAAEFLRDRIDQLRLTGTELIGPAPCFFQKVNRFYRWHLLLRGPNPAAALTNVEIPKGWFVDVDPVEVL